MSIFLLLDVIVDFLCPLPHFFFLAYYRGLNISSQFGGQMLLAPLQVHIFSQLVIHSILKNEDERITSQIVLNSLEFCVKKFRLL